MRITTDTIGRTIAVAVLSPSLLTLAIGAASCRRGEARRSEGAEEPRAEVIRAALELVGEQPGPVLSSSPAVRAFKSRYPQVIGLYDLSVAGSRHVLIPNGAQREYLDETVAPITGILYFEGGRKINIIEFRREYRAGPDRVPATLVVQIITSGEPASKPGY